MGRWLLVVLACTACRLRFEDRGDADGDGAIGGPGDGACSEIPGLLAYFPMEAADLSGATLRDRSGNQHDGTVTGDSAVLPTISSMGHLGSSFDLRGTTFGNREYVDVGGLPLPSAMGDGITVSLWFFRPIGVPLNDVLIDAPPPPPSIVRFDVWLNANRLCINTASNDCWGINSTTLYDHWIHLVAIMRNGPSIDSELYVDGTKQASSCLTDPMYPCDSIRTLAPPVVLGAGDMDYTYRGLFDEVRFYDHALTPEQIAALAQDQTCL